MSSRLPGLWPSEAEAAWGRAVSELARRGFKSVYTTRTDDDPTVFAVAADAEAFTSDDVYRSLDEWP